VTGRVAASLMLVLWLGTVAAAISPQLHLIIHKDARATHHSCVVTQVQEDGILGGCDFIVVASPSVPLAQISLAFDSEHYSPRDYRIAPSRAPPVSLSSATVVG
jgi:hypothetical protein